MLPFPVLDRDARRLEQALLALHVRPCAGRAVVVVRAHLLTQGHQERRTSTPGVQFGCAMKLRRKAQEPRQARCDRDVQVSQARVTGPQPRLDTRVDIAEERRAAQDTADRAEVLVGPREARRDTNGIQRGRARVRFHRHGQPKRAAESPDWPEHKGLMQAGAARRVWPGLSPFCSTRWPGMVALPLSCNGVRTGRLMSLPGIAGLLARTPTGGYHWDNAVRGKRRGGVEQREERPVRRHRGKE